MVEVPEVSGSTDNESETFESGRLEELRGLINNSLINDSLELTVEDVLNQSLDRGDDVQAVTRKVVSSVIEGLSKQQDPERKIRSVSEAAVLTVARRWGNVVHAGRASVEATCETAERAGLNLRAATEQATIGAVAGVKQVGPVAFPHLKRELAEFVEDLDELLERNKRLPAIPSGEHPIIVPDEDEPEADQATETTDEAAPAEATPRLREPIKEMPKQHGFLGRLSAAFRRMLPF